MADLDDYRCPTCDLDYSRLDATTWYCAWCNGRMTERDSITITEEERRRLIAEAEREEN